MKRRDLAMGHDDFPRTCTTNALSMPETYEPAIMAKKADRPTPEDPVANKDVYSDHEQQDRSTKATCIKLNTLLSLTDIGFGADPGFVDLIHVTDLWFTLCSYAISLPSQARLQLNDSHSVPSYPYLCRN